MPVVFESSKTPQTQETKKREKIHPHHRMSPLSSFAKYPNNVRFETQEQEETIELFLRQHPIVNISWIFISIVLILAPIFVFPLFNYLIQVKIPLGYNIMGTLFWYLATLGFILVNFIHWFFNIYIVTNERIVDIDFLYLLYKRLSQAELDKIQDISYTAGGILATVFDYGNIYIQTAGEVPNIEFIAVPHPEKVVETIRSLVEELNEGRMQ